ncbi:glycosyltransferase, partial [Candidatus Woesearchaeota archaeon]|nr:glycosyltransferase [Candidatus Woesearchaeota archaeon]
QNYSRKKYEILVVNDASTDETMDVMNSFMGYIRPVHLDKNIGLSEARNIGIKRALGKYVVNVDADDYIGESLLLIESAFMEQHADWDAVSCDYDLIDDEGNVLETKSGKEEPIACGIMFKKDMLFDIGLYDPRFKAMEEKELRQRFESKYKIENINLSLYRYRRHDNNLTNDAKAVEHYSKLLKDKKDNERA